MDSRVKHGGYRQIGRLDWRSREARFVGEVEAEMVAALGGEPIVQESLLIRRAAVRSMRLALMESELLKSGSDVPATLAKDYLRWSRELREDLKILGLQRRAKPVQDLNTYLSEQYGNRSSVHAGFGRRIPEGFLSTLHDHHSGSTPR